MILEVRDMGEKQKGLVILWGRGNRRNRILRGHVGIIVQLLCKSLAICVVEERLPGVTPGRWRMRCGRPCWKKCWSI